jgi:hypothetical protein
VKVRRLKRVAIFDIQGHSLGSDKDFFREAEIQKQQRDIDLEF